MMAARGRVYSQDWDPMRDDYDNSTYDRQYPDDSSSGLVNLDHCRLYITNIPKGLNQEGIHTVFSKYGTLVEAFVSKNPEKRYGLVSFETPGEAKLAMMKLNRTEPLQLSISIAHKAKNQQKDSRDHVSGGQRDRDARSYRDDAGSVGSRSNNNIRKQEDLANGDNMEDMIDDDVVVVGLNNSLDPDTSMELENLRLEHLKLQEAQVLCKHRMLLLKQAEKKSSATSRCILPNGRIVVRNVDKSEAGRDGDASYVAGAGDSRVANCVACGGAASLFCGGCGVTPYCSPACQRRDYSERHRQVCHNLKRSVGGTAASSTREHQVAPADDVALLPAAMPLRRPRSPESVKRERHSDDSGSERPPNPNHKFGPPGSVVAATYKNPRAGTSSCQGGSRPSQGDSRPSQGDARPSQGYARPGQGDARPSQGDSRPSQGDARPSQGYARPGQGDARPSQGDSRPSQGDARPSQGYARPGQGDARPSQSDSRPSQEYARPSQSDSRPSQGYARPGQSSGRDDKPRFRGNQDESGRQNQDGARNGRGNDRFDSRKQNRDDGERPSRLSDRLNNRGGQERKFENRAQPEEEEWGAKPAAKPAPKPEPKPEPKPVDIPTPKPKSPTVQLMEPKLQSKVAKEEVKVVKSTPDVVSSSRQLVPKDCLVDHLAVNDTFTLSVDSLAADCRAGAGFVCLSLNEQSTEQYMQLLQDDFTADCQASQPITPKPGESFVYLNLADGAWYRARCLSACVAALLDASKLGALDGAAECRALPDRYAALPEYSCLLQAPAAQLADNFTCTVVSKSGGALNVTLVNIATGAPQGSGTVKRWLPAVDYPAEPAPAPAPAPAAPTIPEVPRPPLADKSRVILVDATEPGRLFVRSAAVDQQKEFDDVGMEVAVYGMTATPLTESPMVGQTVVAKYTDGMCYRALCRRVNSKLNKYLLEYIEYGNTTVAFLEDLYACPPELTLASRPTLVSQATLQMSQKSFNNAATQYLEGLKNENTELILTIPSGAPSACSGSAVRLSVAQSGADVNRTVSTLCTPEWVKLLERGGDVMEVRAPVFEDLTYVDLPSAEFELEVLDSTVLVSGNISGHARGAPHAARALALSEPLAEYCNSPLCKDPYLPRPEELCVAMCPKRNRWVRATMLQQESGAGGATADVLLFDYGELAVLPVTQLRRMMPEFVAGLPAACCSVEIKDFPKEPTEAQLAAARQHMKVDARGVGSLRVARAHKQAAGEFLVEAPELIRAMAA